MRARPRPPSSSAASTRARESQMDNGDDTSRAQSPVPPWRDLSRMIDVSDAEDAEIDDAIPPSISIKCQTCKGNTGCEMARQTLAGREIDDSITLLAPPMGVCS